MCVCLCIYIYIWQGFGDGACARHRPKRQESRCPERSHHSRQAEVVFALGGASPGPPVCDGAFWPAYCPEAPARPLTFLAVGSASNDPASGVAATTVLSAGPSNVHPTLGEGPCWCFRRARRSRGKAPFPRSSFKPCSGLHIYIYIYIYTKCCRSDI